MIYIFQYNTQKYVIYLELFKISRSLAIVFSVEIEKNVLI